jgi:hypothetical protein
MINLIGSSRMTTINVSLLTACSIAQTLFINGCSFVWHGRVKEIARTQVDESQIGVSNKENIIQLFGEPQKIVQKPNGVEHFVYIHGVEKAIGIPWILTVVRGGGAGQSLSVAFDKYGVVIDYEYTVDQRFLTR